MKEVIQGRELFTFEVLGNTIRALATCHKTNPDVHGRLPNHKSTGNFTDQWLAGAESG